MSIINRLFGRGSTAEAEAPAADASHCPHVSLAPGWDNPADIGKEAKATHFTCNTCSADFSADEARALRETEAQRLRRE